MDWASLLLYYELDMDIQQSSGPVSEVWPETAQKVQETLRGVSSL